MSEVIRAEDERSDLISILRNCSLIKQIGNQLLVFVNEERALEGLLVLNEPVELDALLGGWPFFNVGCQHGVEQLLAVRADSIDIHAHRGEGVRVLVGEEDLPSIVALEEAASSQQIVEETPQAEDICLHRERFPIENLRRYVPWSTAFLVELPPVIASAGEPEVSDAHLELVFI